MIFPNRITFSNTHCPIISTHFERRNVGVLTKINDFSQDTYILKLIEDIILITYFAILQLITYSST